MKGDFPALPKSSFCRPAELVGPVPTGCEDGFWGRVCSLHPSAWLQGFGFSASIPEGLRSHVPAQGLFEREMPGRNCLSLR